MDILRHLWCSLIDCLEGGVWEGYETQVDSHVRIPWAMAAFRERILELSSDLDINGNIMLWG